MAGIWQGSPQPPQPTWIIMNWNCSMNCPLLVPICSDVSQERTSRLTAVKSCEIPWKCVGGTEPQSRLQRQHLPAGELFLTDQSKIELQNCCKDLSGLFPAMSCLKDAKSTCANTRTSATTREKKLWEKHDKWKGLPEKKHEKKCQEKN